jgi:hypothetical protein
MDLSLHVVGSLAQEFILGNSEDPDAKAMAETNSPIHTPS